MRFVRTLAGETPAWRQASGGRDDGAPSRMITVTSEPRSAMRISAAYSDQNTKKKKRVWIAQPQQHSFGVHHNARRGWRTLKEIFGMKLRAPSAEARRHLWTFVKD